MKRVTNSEMSSWKWCRRNWYYTYYRQLAPTVENPVSAASLGTLVHLGLEQHYLGQNALYFMQARIDVDREALVLAEASPDKLKKFDKQAALALVMVEGYISWLEETGADSDFEVLAAERAVEVEILPGVALLGKQDLLIQKKSDGTSWFLDFKTAASIEQIADGAYMSDQMRTYQLLAYLEHLNGNGQGTRPAGAILSVLRKVGRTAASKPPFYGRETVSFNEHVLRSHWHHVVATIGDIQSAEARLTAGEDHHTVVPPSPGRDCAWRCRAATLCRLQDDGSDVEAVIEAFFETRDPLARYGDADENVEAE